MLTLMLSFIAMLLLFVKSIGVNKPVVDEVVYSDDYVSINDKDVKSIDNVYDLYSNCIPLIDEGYRDKVRYYLRKASYKQDAVMIAAMINNGLLIRKDNLLIKSNRLIAQLITVKSIY